jgi:hypothetical protein
LKGDILFYFIFGRFGWLVAGAGQEDGEENSTLPKKEEDKETKIKARKKRRRKFFTLSGCHLFLRRKRWKLYIFDPFWSKSISFINV